MPESIKEMLGAQPKPVTRWYAVTNEVTAEGAPTRAKVKIFDAIGGWFGTNAAEFVDEIDALDVDELEVHVNSPGGAVWDGIAIMNALKAHRARVTVIVDGLAASAASIVAMGGDEVVMAEGSQMMIHQASGGVYGNSDFMRDTASLLDKIDSNMAGIYARKAGGTRDSWLALMNAETWYNADEAVAAGLADRADASIESVDAEAAFDLRVFNYAGRSKAPAPHRQDMAAMAATRTVPVAAATLQAPVSTEPGNTTERESDMSDALKAGLVKRLGITDAELDENGILAALDEALNEQAEDTNVATFTAPAGTIVVDAAQFEALKGQAAEGAQARAEQIKASRDALIEAAVADGRLAPASRDTWRARMDENETGTTALLATLAPNAVPVVPLGHAMDNSAEDAEYRRYYPGATNTKNQEA